MPIIGIDDKNRLAGTLLADSILGRSGDGESFGLDGNDALYAKHGNDVLRGSASADTFHTAAGNDRMTGGGGDDTVISSGLTGRDTLTGFPVTNDEIQIRVRGVDDFDDLRFTQTGEGDAIVSCGSLAAEPPSR